MGKTSACEHVFIKRIDILFVSLTEHALLHRRNKTRFKGSNTETHPDVEPVDHVVVSELANSEVNRDLYGTRIEGLNKIIIWGASLLKVQDNIELNNDDVQKLGEGDMYEITKVLKDNINVANFAVYIARRLQQPKENTS